MDLGGPGRQRDRFGMGSSHTRFPVVNVACFQGMKEDQQFKEPASATFSGQELQGNRNAV